MSLALGLIMVNLLQPGVGLSLPLPRRRRRARTCRRRSLSLKDFVTHLVPKSIVEAMANNEILQIVVFSLFFGVAAGRARRAAARRSSTCDRRSWRT